MSRRFRLVLVTILAVFVIALPAQALAAIRIHRIYFDSPGSDNGSNASLNAEYIVIKNTGSSRVGIGGRTIRDVAGHVYRFSAGFRIGGGAKVWLTQAVARAVLGIATGARATTCGTTTATPPG